jgi:hypothetical protein
MADVQEAMVFLFSYLESLEGQSETGPFYFHYSPDLHPSEKTDASPMVVVQARDYTSGFVSLMLAAAKYVTIADPTKARFFEGDLEMLARLDSPQEMIEAIERVMQENRMYDDIHISPSATESVCVHMGGLEDVRSAILG